MTHAPGPVNTPTAQAVSLLYAYMVFFLVGATTTPTTVRPRRAEEYAGRPGSPTARED